MQFGFPKDISTWVDAFQGSLALTQDASEASRKDASPQTGLSFVAFCSLNMEFAASLSKQICWVFLLVFLTNPWYCFSTLLFYSKI